MVRGRESKHVAGILRKRRPGFRGAEDGIGHAGKNLVSRAEACLPFDEVVVRAVDRAQAIGQERVCRLGSRFRRLNLLENELKVRPDERSHLRSLHSDADKKPCSDPDALAPSCSAEQFVGTESARFLSSRLFRRALLDGGVRRGGECLAYRRRRSRQGPLGGELEWPRMRNGDACVGR